MSRRNKGSRRKGHRHPLNRRGRPRRSSGIDISITDTQNGWPLADAAIGAINNEVGISHESHNSEAAARVATIETARSWNSMLSMFPFNILADVFGFRPWKYGPSARFIRTRRNRRRQRRP